MCRDDTCELHCFNYACTHYSNNNLDAAAQKALAAGSDGSGGNSAPILFISFAALVAMVAVLFF